MSVTAEQLKLELAQLPAPDRAALAQYLIRSLGEGPQANAEADWDQELEQRAQEIRNGTAQGEPAEKVFQELRRKYS